ncbi:STAS domain-containing protein [Spongiactinospora sp. TRM90649]|uniref:STAS domain-containing protein n=1 Tax=Spongiactinospora sp. TRM90649 TaxID=3031114 RepID=UPI0023F776AD|nr:STAS domain-containing protein [Spongiactinospora sp. TRM90649]MDF5753235.1 STAS domain-containing protein [Spongiactinospora sp. TRM90649]
MAETVAVINLAGELDATTVHALLAVLEQLTASPVTHVIVAARELSFCDMSGVEQLAATHQTLLAKGGRLVIAEPGPGLCRLLEVMAEHVRPAIQAFPALTEALADAGVDLDAAVLPLLRVRRHLPRYRRIPHVAVAPGRAGTRHLRPGKPPAQEQPSQPPPPADTRRSLINRSHELRRQARQQVNTMQWRLFLAGRSRTTLSDTLDRCRDTLAMMRAKVRESPTRTGPGGPPPAGDGQAR